MNTFKKLMFGLLLSGMAFTAACGDTTGDKLKEGKPCESKDACDTGLKCVIGAKGKAKGVCKVECTAQNAPTKCTKTGAKACVKTMEHGASAANIMTCGADAGGVIGTAELGARCTAGSTDAATLCKDGLVCYTDNKCYEKCDSDITTAAAPKCAGKKSGADPNADATTCMVSGDMKVCVAPDAGTPPKLGEGVEGCTTDGAAATTCDTGLTCVKVIPESDKTRCMLVCQTKGAASNECANSKEFSHCMDGVAKNAEDNDAPVKVCSGGGGPKTGATAGLGDTCDDSSANENEKCGRGLTCHSVDHKCYATCSAAGAAGDAECTASGALSGSDKTAAAPKCTADGQNAVCTASP